MDLTEFRSKHCRALEKEDQAMPFEGQKGSSITRPSHDETGPASLTYHIQVPVGTKLPLMRLSDCALSHPTKLSSTSNSTSWGYTSSAATILCNSAPFRPSFCESKDTLRPCATIGVLHLNAQQRLGFVSVDIYCFGMAKPRSRHHICELNLTTCSSYYSKGINNHQQFTMASQKPKKDPMTFQESLSRMIAAQCIGLLAGIPALALCIILFRKFSETPDLAQAIVAGVQIIWFASNVYVLMSLQPPLTEQHYIGPKTQGKWKLRYVGISDGLFGIAGGVFSILSGVDMIEGKAREQTSMDRILLFVQVFNSVVAFAVCGAARALEKELLPERDNLGEVVKDGTGKDVETGLLKSNEAQVQAQQVNAVDGASGSAVDGQRKGSTVGATPV
ncbi:hypothetical protein BJ508DRAFT_312927 [Ascobolus immersus RN42]|uniref:Uncharacterized protein n=1 Tax=Ascobolus immersus RN42 TaxID=1160509 RepID=A0A3N4HKF8_ASCIM|nr:hypothetical protein BJ508DRAFT_312927 [Ascobolus immersus RN42]